jgi:glycosyltransferase involved in cell wall biosynthesis
LRFVTASVSLVIPNQNNEPALDLVFERLAANTRRPVQVVVIDDGSTDRSREILRRWRDSGRFADFVLHEQDASGVVVALNKGLELADGDLVVQLDADATVETPGWVDTMAALFEGDDQVGVVSPRVVFDWGRVHALGVNIVGPKGLYDRGSEIAEPVGRRTEHRLVKRMTERQLPFVDEFAEVDSGIGCCMMYRRADALAVGGYDMGFQPVWFDDLDLALSIRHKLGKRNFYTPDVRVIHRTSLRHTRDGPPPRREVFQARVGQRIPRRLKQTLKVRVGIGGGPSWERLLRHYAYWREKWGWDLLNPDMAAVRKRYAGSELLWADARGEAA